MFSTDYNYGLIKKKANAFYYSLLVSLMVSLHNALSPNNVLLV